MITEGEESEEEEEEEEEIEMGLEPPHDEQAKNVFLQQQHRIVRRFCINAKVSIADGARFHQLINDCNQMVISAFEVFALNRLEEDFIENLNIISDISAK